jgi:pilus assembly protein Flp/PilA
MIDYIKTWIALKADKRAVTALEYALIAAAIAGVIVTSAGTIGTNISAKFTSLAGSI